MPQARDAARLWVTMYKPWHKSNTQAIAALNDCSTSSVAYALACAHPEMNMQCELTGDVNGTNTITVI